MKRKILNSCVLLALLSTTLLTACDNSLGKELSKSFEQTSNNPSTNPTNPVNPTTPNSTGLVGHLIDAPVEGMTYKTATRTGVTGKNGVFYYDNPNEKIEFFLGNQKLAKAKAMSEVHIYDVEPTLYANNNERKAYVERLAQTLQILDADNNPENGIQLDTNNRIRLENTLRVDVGSESLQAILLKKDSQYIQDELRKIKNRFISPEQAKAHAEKNKYCSSIADTTYYLPGVQDKFSTAGRTCVEKAQALAFYGDVALDMGQHASQFHSDFLENVNEKTVHEGIKHAVETNFVANAVNATAKYIQMFGNLQSIHNDEEKKKQALKITAQESLKFINTSLELVQGLACAGKSPEECEKIKDTFKTSLLPAIFDVLTTASECEINSTNINKCVEAVTKIIDEGSEAILSSDEKKKIAKDITNTGLFMVKTITNLASGAINTDKTNLYKVTGEMVDDIIKFSTGFNVRDDEESALRGGWVNAIEITGEIAKTGGACAGVFDGTDTITAFGECVEAVNKYGFQRIAEIMFYYTAGQEVQNADLQLTKANVAQAFLAEYIRLGTNGNDKFCDSNMPVCHLRGNNKVFYKTYADVDDFNSLNTEEKRKALRKAISILTIAKFSDKRIVLKSDAQDIVNMVLLYGNSIVSKANQVLAGTAGGAVTIQLGEITSPQLQRYPAPPSLVPNRNKVDINKPITFTAVAQLSQAIKGYKIDIIGAENKTVYSDLPVLQHTFKTAGHYQVSITPIIKKTNGDVTPIPAKSQVLAFDVLGSTIPKITDFSPTHGNLRATSVLFKVKGENLPLTAILAIEDAECQQPIERTATGFMQYCKLNGQPDEVKKVTIKTNTQTNNGKIIDNNHTVTLYNSGPSFGAVPIQTEVEIEGGVNIVKTSTGFKLNSRKATGPVMYYELYRSTQYGLLGQKIAQSWGEHFVDINVVKGTVYYYTIKACDEKKICATTNQDYSEF